MFVGYKSLRKLRNLEIMDLSYNRFNNSILPFLNAATSLTSLSLENNDMEGPFPFEGVFPFVTYFIMLYICFVRSFGLM